MGFLSSLFSGASKALSYAPRVFGAFEKGAKKSVIWKKVFVNSAPQSIAFLVIK